MTLRTRLISGVLLLLAVFVVGAAVTVVTQRGHLLDQIDDQLRTTPPPNQGRVPDEEREEPISDLYIARIETDQELNVLIRGQRLTDSPATDELLANPPAEETILTVPGEDGGSDFRVLYMPAVDDRPAALIALPLDEVDDTVRQLIYTSAIVAALMAGVAAILASWVNRFGLRPIGEMTAVADAIAAGETTTRAESYGPDTEAGRLSRALNQMLDERDRAETTLRSFAANASHELRTPLTSIRGFLDLYEQGAFREPEQLDDMVRRMRIESARMNLLVEELLLLAKLDEQQPLDVALVDLSVLLNDVAASAKAAHPNRTIEVAAIVDAARQVMADPLRLQQAVASLVDNAITHTDAVIALDAQTTATAISITVTDEGPGLAPEVAAHVFDRFYRGDPSRSRISGGSGLGLSIAKSIVEAHDGTITLDTSVSSGSTFSIQLPVARIDTTGAASKLG